MKIGLISDLHMDFDNRNGGIPYKFVRDPKVDFYICAGDIHSDPLRRDVFINDNKNYMLCIRGNHDFYSYKNNFEDSITETVIHEVDGIKIAAATLWTEFKSYSDWQMYVRCLNDKHCIDGMTFDLYQETHKRHLDFLLNSEADIIVTHHAPSFKSIHPRYAGDIANICFASDLDAKICSLAKPPKYWVHGHVHDPHDYMIGSTRVVCNPRGYPREREYYYTYEPKILEV